MPRHMTQKLIIRAASTASDRGDTTVHIRPELYRQLDDLRMQTGKSISELVTILLQYAIENTVIEED